MEYVETSVGTRHFVWGWEEEETSGETVTTFNFLLYNARISAYQSDCPCHMTFSLRMLITCMSINM